MGCRPSKTEFLTAEEKAQEIEQRKLEKNLKKTQETLKEQNALRSKALLLGAGESGKSTLFKQIILNYGTGFTETDISNAKSNIKTNLFIIVKTLLRQAEHYGKTDGQFNFSRQTSDALKSIFSFGKNGDEFDENFISPIENLLNDPALGLLFAHSNEYQLIDTASYILERAGAILSPDYTPTIQDVLCSRARTTGILEMEFDLADNDRKLVVVDVGGQRNERKKWINCFDNVANIIFVVSLSGYNQRVYEEQSVVRIDEALALFKEIVQNERFCKTSVILLLNKFDLFSKKLTRFPLEAKFSDFKGDGTAETAAEFIKYKFKALNTNKLSISVHFTTATDVDNMKKLLKSLRSNLINAKLDNVGLV